MTRRIGSRSTGAVLSVLVAGAVLTGSAAATSPAGTVTPAAASVPALASTSVVPAAATAPVATAPPAALIPLPASTTQAVVVGSPSSEATAGTLSTWQRDARGAWVRVLGPVTAHLGGAGIGAASESSQRTPAGTFGLTEAFGRAPDPGTTLPYLHVGRDDWWVSDTRSPAYNTHQVCAPGTCRFDEARGENLDAAGTAYDDAVVIDANRAPVRPGAGSAFFLHVGSTPTAGCVAVDRATVVAVLRWLRPAAHPVIAIG